MKKGLSWHSEIGDTLQSGIFVSFYSLRIIIEMYTRFWPLFAIKRFDSCAFIFLDQTFTYVIELNLSSLH